MFITFNEIRLRLLTLYPELGSMIIRRTSPMIPLFDIWGRQAFGPPLPKEALRGKKYKTLEKVAFEMDWMELTLARVMWQEHSTPDEFPAVGASSITSTEDSTAPSN